MGSGQSSSKKSGQAGGPNDKHVINNLSQNYGAPPVYSSNNTASAPQMSAYGGEAPPAYSATPSNSLVTGSCQPQVQQYSAQYMAQHYGAFPPAAPSGPVHGQFDAGARFSARAPPSIPPPPPGVAPNQAQLAAMQGRQVIMGQKEGGVMSGSGSGGYTFW